MSKTQFGIIVSGQSNEILKELLYSDDVEMIYDADPSTRFLEFDTKFHKFWPLMKQKLKGRMSVLSHDYELWTDKGIRDCLRDLWMCYMYDQASGVKHMHLTFGKPNFATLNDNEEALNDMKNIFFALSGMLKNKQEPNKLTICLEQLHTNSIWNEFPVKEFERPDLMINLKRAYDLKYLRALEKKYQADETCDDPIEAIRSQLKLHEQTQVEEIHFTFDNPPRLWDGSSAALKVLIDDLLSQMKLVDSLFQDCTIERMLLEPTHPIQGSTRNLLRCVKFLTSMY